MRDFFHPEREFSKVFIRYLLHCTAIKPGMDDDKTANGI